MDVTAIVLIVIAILLVVLLVDNFRRRGSGDDSKVREQLNTKTQELEAVNVKYAAATAKNEGLQQLIADLRQDLDYERQMRKKELEKLAAEQIEAAKKEGKVLEKLAPVSETLVKMQQKVEELEGQRKEQYGALDEALKQSHNQQEEIKRVTSSLSGALRSNQTRGQWGELQLKRIVEGAGMREHVDFDVQVSQGDSRLDMLIHLPEGKSIIIDAKVPADKYLEAANIDDFAEDEQLKRKKQLQQEHVKAVRLQIDQLSKKNYPEQIRGLQADYVIMFLPSEAMLSAALDSDPTLLEYSFKQHIALSGPVSLFSVLKTVSYIWQQQAMNQNVEQVSAMAVELRDRVCKLLEHANKLAGTLSGSVDAYNKFASTLNKQVVSQINAIDDKMHKNRIELETISKKDEGKLDAKEAVLQITNIVDTDNMENLQKKLQQ